MFLKNHCYTVTKKLYKLTTTKKGLYVLFFKKFKNCVVRLFLKMSLFFMLVNSKKV